MGPRSFPMTSRSRYSQRRAPEYTNRPGNHAGALATPASHSCSARPRADALARAAASLGRASAAAIILRRHESATGLAVAGSHGLGEEYARELNRIRPIEV